MKRNKPIEKECPCGKVFKTYQVLVDKGKGKFCGKKCMYKYKKERTVFNYTIHKDNIGWFKKGEVESNRSRKNVPTICGVYKITNPNGGIYIGSSSTIYRRWLRHREGNRNMMLHQSIKNHGWRNHKFEVVHELPIDSGESVLITYEQLYIDLYKDCGCVMLNEKDAGSSGKFSEEYKQRMIK